MELTSALCSGADLSSPNYVIFYLWLTLIADITSVLTYVAVIFYLRRLETNFFVNRHPERRRQVSVGKTFAWVTLSDLLLEVIPYTIRILPNIFGLSEFLFRFNASLIVLNRCVNVFVYSWKFRNIRTAIRNIFGFKVQLCKFKRSFNNRRDMTPYQ